MIALLQASASYEHSPVLGFTLLSPTLNDDKPRRSIGGLLPSDIGGLVAPQTSEEWFPPSTIFSWTFVLVKLGMGLHKVNPKPIWVVLRTASRSKFSVTSTTKTLLRTRLYQQQRNFSTTSITMSGTVGMLAEAYSAAVSPSTSPNSAPEGPKVWHRKGGGFRNPWPRCAPNYPFHLLSNGLTAIFISLVGLIRSPLKSSPEFLGRPRNLLTYI